MGNVLTLEVNKNKINQAELTAEIKVILSSVCYNIGISIYHLQQRNI